MTEKELEKFADELVSLIDERFEEFMSKAICAKGIRDKGMVETAKAVFAAGFADGVLAKSQNYRR